MQLFLFLLCSFTVTSPAQARDPASLEVPVDSLVAQVGHEAVLNSDLSRFSQVNDVLACAGVIQREKPLPKDPKALLDAYVEEELIYLEAKAKKTATAGMIPQAVKAIHDKSECHNQWQNLGKKYSSFWRTETRVREGESLLVRELERQVLIERFRKTEILSDADLWRREAKTRYPVKILLQ
ncbi:MAG: hypothetical protein ACXWQO_20020 [Bdellovibrionota bacterium]